MSGKLINFPKRKIENKRIIASAIPPPPIDVNKTLLEIERNRFNAFFKFSIFLMFTLFMLTLILILTSKAAALTPYLLKIMGQ